MWLMFNQMADDIPSEPCTNQTIVSLLEDHFRPPAPNGLSRTLPVLKCSALRLRGTVNKADFKGNCLEFCCMLNKNNYNFLKFAEICVAILDDRLFFCFYC